MSVLGMVAPSMSMGSLLAAGSTTTSLLQTLTATAAELQRCDAEGISPSQAVLDASQHMLTALRQGIRSDVPVDPEGWAGYFDEWRESVRAELIGSPETVRRLFGTIADELQRHGVFAAVGDQPIHTPQVNTIPAYAEQPFPGGDVALQHTLQLTNALKWNAMAMVAGANERHPGVGGHIGTFASSAEIMSVLLTQFFRGKNAEGGGDQLFIQGHDSPGIYAFDHLMGGLSEAQLLRFRREVGVQDSASGTILIDAGTGKGLSSYPHTFLMPDKWEFHSVSMGLANQMAIRLGQANHWLHHQGLADTSGSRVWGIFGDGSAEEPESQVDLYLAAQQKLPVKFLFNCNLQRLDGPVRGNENIMWELESRYRGAGWKVIKVMHSHDWDDLFARDPHGLIAQRMAEIPDGQFQTYQVEGGAYLREHFFGKRGPFGQEQENPELLQVVAHLSDDQLAQLRWGGHDYERIYNAMRVAEKHDGPAVILFRTVKGNGIPEMQSTMSVHGNKKLKGRVHYRDVLNIPLDDESAQGLRLYQPDSDEGFVEFARERRAVLGGSALERRQHELPCIELPDSIFSPFDEASRGRNGVSSTMVWMRMWEKIMSDPAAGKYFTEIVADEIRTFGGDGHIRKFGLYHPAEQRYLPADHQYKAVRYTEGPEGRIHQVGISEAAAISTFTSLATMYSTHGAPVVPAYIFYSKFGFQRIGDQIWGAGDMRARGFLIGATAGRTTLNGEGLQHEDGESHLMASAYPSVRAYDPAFAYELAAITREGIRRMYGADESHDEIYYLTVYNENHQMPARPQGVTDAMINSGLYLFREASAELVAQGAPQVQLLGSGTLMFEAIRAQELLADAGVAAHLYSVTSYVELAREAERAEEHNLWHPGSSPRVSHVSRSLKPERGPVIAASDYVKALPRLIQPWLRPSMIVLGTDGYGRSDTREVLRRFFRVDAESTTVAAMAALARAGHISPERVQSLIDELGFDSERPHPLDLRR